MKKLFSDERLNQIRELQDICETYEDIRLKLNWDMLRSRDEENNADLFYYVDDQLIAFLGVYQFGNKYELCGMVHPEYRRKGIFRQLLKKALESIHNANTILLNSPAKSESGKKFLDNQRCTYSFSEYQMVWKEKQMKEFNKIVNLTRATKNDIDLMARLDVECFGFGFDDANEYTKRIFNEDHGTLNIIEANGEKIGKIRVQEENKESWIYGFAILPNYQGKGYGRNTLQQIIEKEKAKGNKIHLEVALENQNAKKLYTDIGFEQYDTQDYYLYQINK